MNALVTGASSGIGLEFSRVLAVHGHDLILVARREAVLAELARDLTRRYGIRCEVRAADLSSPGAATALAESVARAGVKLDVLVNNAGFGMSGRFDRSVWTNELAMLQVNVLALTELTKRFLPGMLERGSGRIVNVASTAAFQPGPYMNVYYASKAYVLSFSEALAEELRGTGITVTALCPGPTRSGFQRVAGIEESRLIKGKRLADAASVARFGYTAMMKGKRIAIPGFWNHAVAVSVGSLPRSLVARAVGMLNRRASA